MKNTVKIVTMVLVFPLIVILGSFSRLITKELFGSGLALVISDAVFICAFIYLLFKLRIIKRAKKEQRGTTSLLEKIDFGKLTPQGWIVIVLSMSLILGWFYWFQIRPAEARKYCVKEARGLNLSAFGEKSEVFNEEKFEACMLLRGIKP